MKFAHLLIILTAVIAVAVADVFLKEAAKSDNFSLALKSPYFWSAVVLYLYQIGAFTYLFVSNVELSIVGIIETALYAVIVLASGYFIFGEKLTAVKYLGLILAIAGVLLIYF